MILDDPSRVADFEVGEWFRPSLPRRLEKKRRARMARAGKKSVLALTRQFPELCNNKRRTRRRWARPVYEFRVAAYAQFISSAPSCVSVTL